MAIIIACLEFTLCAVFAGITVCFLGAGETVAAALMLGGSIFCGGNALIECAAIAGRRE